MNDYGGRSEGQYKGSVRRARERMEAGLPPEMPSAKTAYEQRSNAPSPPNQSRRQAQEPLGSSIGESAIGVAISRPIPAPQWPLMDNTKTVPVQQFVSDPAYRPPPGRAIAPQRPPRPSRVPSILDASQPQEHVPAFAYNGQSNIKPPPTPQYADEDLFSPNNNNNNNPRSPETPSASSGSGSSSRPSTMSSVGTIPDFPLPILGPRRSGTLGPPPSARRGASSYYSSHASYVSPIPEESPRTQRSHTSYASSAAIPSSWGSASPGYYYDGEQSPRDNRGIMSEHGIIEEGHESRESNYDTNEEQSLVRQASVGKRGKPSLINTKSTENMEPPARAGPSPLPSNNPPAPGLWGLRESAGPEAAVAAAVAAGFATEGQAGARETIWPTGNDPNPPTIPNIPPDLTTRTQTPPSANTEWTEPTTASSETVPTVGRALSTSERLSYCQSRQQNPPIPSRSDARVSQILGAHEAASAIDPSAPPLEREFSRLSAIRRPPRLDIDAVRKAEARGSLTSLPDLIRRATRLASMMEKGRRPASRFDWQTSPGGKSMIGMDRFQAAGNQEKHQTSGQTSGIGDMLAAFPAPGVATPTREVEARPAPRSPGFLDEKSSFDDVAKEPQSGKKQRRCCGLPLCGFVVIIIIVLLAVVAGIVVPIELLVVHKTKPSAPNQLTLASCIAQVTCLNGGNNDISSGVCSCICVNGFTGPTCASDDTAGCTTADIGNTFANVTLGNSLPRLIAQAESNFTIPLSSTVILSRLNAANTSCVLENALVAFNGFSDRTATSSSGVVLPVVQNANLVLPAAASETIALAGSETIALAGTNTANAVAISVTIELGSTASGNTITIDLTGSSTAATAAAAATTTSVTVDLEGSSTTSGGSVTVTLGSQTTTSTTAVTTAATTTVMTSATTSSTTPTASFAASQEVLDFARVAILFILQQENLSDATTAQTSIQSFLSSSSSTNARAQNISIGNGNTIDLVNFAVDVGNGTVGALTSTASKRLKRKRDPHSLPYRANRAFQQQ